jgi:hypothetical protein
MSLNPALYWLTFATATLLFSLGGGKNVISQDASGPYRFKQIQEVVDDWDINQHLYVKGDVGVSNSQLKRLKKWLDANAKNWTIVLMDSSRGQAFRTATDKRFTGRDAVYYALGHGLSNSTAFGDQLHPISREPYGAIFVLFLKDRKFNYFASDAQDRQRLGESNWFGKLDREAIRAMRNGARVADAVKNTIASIDRQLNSRINFQLKAERQKQASARLAKERAIALRQQEIAHLQTLTNDVQNSLLGRVIAGSDKFKTDFPDAATSDLANPPIEQWRTKLKAITDFLKKTKLAAGELGSRLNSLRSQEAVLISVQDQLHRHLDQLAAHASFEEKIQPVQSRLDTNLFHPSRVGILTAEQGFEILELAKRNHALGNFEFIDQIAEAEQAAAEGESLVAAHVELEKQAADRRGIIRRTLLWTLGGLVTLLTFVTAGLNFWRRTFLTDAFAAFQSCQLETQKSDLALTELVTRSHEIIGDRKMFASRGYTGATKKRGLESLRQLDQLQLMSDESQRVLGIAEQQLFPPSIIGQAANMVSSRRYQYCINLLASKSFQLPTNRELDKTTSDDWVSFDVFQNEFNRRSLEVTDQLNALESCFAKIGGELSKLNSGIDSVTDREKTLSSLARRDQFFKTPALFDALLPALQRDWDQVSKVSKTDPLAATTQLIPLSQRKINEAERLIATIDMARETVLPTLDEAADRLRPLGYDVRWIDENARQLSDPANQLFEQVAQESIGDQAKDFDLQVRALGTRAKRSAELAQELANDVGPSIEKLKSRINRERRKISKQLNVPLQSALAEVDYNPDAGLQLAEAQFQSARAALSFGRVTSILESLDVISVEIKRAENFVQLSLDAISNHQSDLANRQEVLERLGSLIPANENELQRRETIYSESSFRIRPGIESNYTLAVEDSDEAPSLQLLMHACKNSVEHCGQLLAAAEIDHREAKVLQAANTLMLVKEELVEVDQTLVAIRQHFQLMDQQDLANRQLFPRVAEGLAQIASIATDPRTQRPTLADFNHLRRSFEKFRQRFVNDRDKRQPFADQNALADVEETLNNLSLAIQADNNAHDEAAKAVAGAESELTRAMTLMQQTSDDQIPDSREIELCRTAVRQAAVRVDEIGRLLKTSHGDWRKVDDEATETNTRLAVTIGELGRQLQLAQRASKSMRAAASAVFEAANWRGSYGISVVARPGSDDLEHARATLGRGEYLRCIQFARSAERLATSAIQAAENQVQAERRRIAREAEARRRRQRRKSSISFGGSSLSSNHSSRSSSFGGSSRSSSFGGSSRSSGASSSGGSHRSNGSSGFGRESGW